MDLAKIKPTLTRTLVLSPVLAGVLVFFQPALAQADSISIRPVADTTLIEVAPDNNLGGGTFFNAGTTAIGTRNRALLLFDLGTTIPAGSIITSAELVMDVVGQPRSGQQNSTFSLRRVLQSWGEGVQVSGDDGPGRGSPAVPGEATWNDRFNSTTAWSQPGGQSGVDFSGTLSSSAFVGGVGAEVVFVSSPALITDVQFWVNNPTANFGWMLKTESEGIAKTARSFAARETGFGPVLKVEFTPVPEPGTILLASLFLAGLGAMRCRRRGRQSRLACLARDR